MWFFSSRGPRAFLLSHHQTIHKEPQFSDPFSLHAFARGVCPAQRNFSLCGLHMRPHSFRLLITIALFATFPLTLSYSAAAVRHLPSMLLPAQLEDYTYHSELSTRLVVFQIECFLRPRT